MENRLEEYKAGDREATFSSCFHYQLRSNNRTGFVAVGRERNGPDWEMFRRKNQQDSVPGLGWRVTN